MALSFFRNLRLQERITPRAEKRIYWTKVSIDTLVLVGVRAAFGDEDDHQWSVSKVRKNNACFQLAKQAIA
jgi:hypothetical protein